MKKLYIVDYWVPFPSSEYGGVVNVIASDDNECHDILLDWRNECENSYDDRIMDAVCRSQRYSLVENVESQIVSTMIT